MINSMNNRKNRPHDYIALILFLFILTSCKSTSLHSNMDNGHFDAKENLAEESINLTQNHIEYGDYSILSFVAEDTLLDHYYIALYQSVSLDFLFAMIEDDVQRLDELCTEVLYKEIQAQREDDQSFYRFIAGSEIQAFNNISGPSIYENVDGHKSVLVTINFNSDKTTGIIHLEIMFRYDFEKLFIESFGL